MSKINRNENNLFLICFSLFYRFQYRNGESDWISFQNIHAGPYSDAIGKKGNKQIINLPNDVFADALTSGGGKRSAIGTPLHEMMHAMGKLIKILYGRDRI